MKFSGQILSVKVKEIDVDGRLRPVDPEWANALAEMIEESGLQNPVVVCETKNCEGAYKLVAGAHRLEAFRILGRAKIDARLATPETDAPELEFRLLEIIENVGRNELSPLDRASNLAELKRVYEELHPDTKAGVAGGKARHNLAGDIMSFAESTAKATGLDKRTIQRSASIWNGLQQDVRAALQKASSNLPQTDLLKLSKMDAERQRSLTALLTDGAIAVSRVSQAEEKLGGPKVQPDPNEKAFARLINVFSDAPTHAQKQFVAWLKDTGHVKSARSRRVAA